MIARGKTIRHFVVMGDSLSDRGRLIRDRKLAGVLPLRWIVALMNKTHNARFTNGLDWDDDIGAMFASQFIAHDLRFHGRKPGQLNPDDISDGIIAHDPNIDVSVDNAYTLDQDEYIKYKNRDFMRTYCEGGLTSHDYSSEGTWSISQLFSRKIVSTLSAMREALFADDEKNKTSDKQKEETLVIEWSGANDLITVNSKPTEEEARKAVAARIANVKELIAKGYKNIALFDMPDLTLTPRFLKASEAERQNIKHVCEYFNQELVKACAELKAQDPTIDLNIFPVSEHFSRIYNNAAQYGLTNTTEPLVESKYYRNTKDPLPSEGYMFFDEIHPTAKTHSFLAEEFYKLCIQSYDVQVPEFDRASTAQCMFEKFMMEYESTFSSDRNGFWGDYRNSNLPADIKGFAIENNRDYIEVLAAIFSHALKDDGKRTLRILGDFGWINSDKSINMQIPVLQRVAQTLYRTVEYKH